MNGASHRPMENALCLGVVPQQIAFVVGQFVHIQSGDRSCFEFTPPDHRPASEPAHSQAAPQKARAAAGRITLNAPLPRSGR